VDIGAGGADGRSAPSQGRTALGFTPSLLQYPGAPQASL